jgi:hypothetical protein
LKHRTSANVFNSGMNIGLGVSGCKGTTLTGTVWNGITKINAINLDKQISSGNGLITYTRTHKGEKGGKTR